MLSYRSAAASIAFLVFAAAASSGCGFEELRENQAALDRQRLEIDKQQHELETIRQQQTYNAAPTPVGSCDPDVMRIATKRGGDSFAAGDYQRAVGYYSDADKACPGNPEAELNLARAYEALGQRDQARKYYQKASESPGSDDRYARQAQEALSRMTRK
jgi:tetratricopeptide (TPR) repeat protein